VAAEAGAKGIADKVSGLVQFPFIARILVPGALGAELVWGFAGWKLTLPAELGTSKLAELGPLLTFLAWSVVLGALFSVVLGDPIYKIYEGLLLWPSRLFESRTARQQARVQSLLTKAEQLKQVKGNAYDRLWFNLRRYPLGPDGEPYASRPTLLGNILASYEDYPTIRYGMDTVFYWPRLWLELDKEKKAEIDGAWAIADGLMSLSAISFAAGLLGLALSGSRVVAAKLASTWPTPFADLASWLAYPPGTSAPVVAALAAVLIAAGYVLYRLSLPFHRRNGEVFKALFDLYRSKLDPMTHVSADERARWRDAWAYLQYFLVRCPQCPDDHYFAASRAQCDRCGHERRASLDAPAVDGQKPRTPSGSFLQWLKSLGG